MIAAANLTYLIGICLPSVAVFLLRKNDPDRVRPFRAPRFTVGLGVFAAAVWVVSTILDRGCHLAHGYLFSPPVPPEEIEALYVSQLRTRARTA